MSETRSATLRLAALKIFRELLETEEATARALVMELANEHGAESLLVRMPDGTELGAIAITKGRESAKVTDERAFLDWVRANAPGEIVETVRDSYRKSVLKRVKAGEELPAGVEIRYGDPYPSVRLNEVAAPAIVAAVRTGDIPPLALPAGES